MNLHIIILLFIFISICVLLYFKRPLWQAIFTGIVLTIIGYQISIQHWFTLVSNVFTTFSSVSVLLSLYLITYLQRMLEKKEQIKLAQEDLNQLFHNRRINATIAPLFIGLLPSAAAMILCGDIVKGSTDGYLKKDEQAFVTSWFRHIPESTLPTYSAVLMMSSLANIELSSFMVGMIPMLIVLFSIGYFRYIRRIPKETNESTNDGKSKIYHLIGIFKHLWSLFLIVILILVFDLSVVAAVCISIILVAIVYRFTLDELKEMIVSAFEKKMLLNTFFVLIFKEFLGFSGVLQELPVALNGLPIPMFLIFVLLFFFGGLISGSAGIIALGTPLAFSSILDGGVSLMILLMCVCHAANLLSPTHVCLVVASEYYDVSLGSLIKKTIPASCILVASAIIYYLLLTFIF